MCNEFYVYIAQYCEKMRHIAYPYINFSKNLRIRIFHSTDIAGVSVVGDARTDQKTVTQNVSRSPEPAKTLVRKRSNPGEEVHNK